MINTSANISCSSAMWDTSASTTRLEDILQGVLMSTSLVLNLCLLITICSSRRLRTSTHLFISSLAVSDVLTSIYGFVRLAILTIVTSMCVPLETRGHIDRLMYMSYVINTFCSYMNILIVSGERWLFISRPFLHQRLISRRFSFLGVAVAWASSLIFNLDIFAFSLKEYWMIAYIKSEIVFPCLHFLLTIVLLCMYIHLTIITRNQMHAIKTTDYLHQSNNDATSSHHSLKNKKMKELTENLRSIRLLVSVFGAFVLLLSPGIYYHSYVRFSPGHQEHPHIHEGLKLLTNSHAFMNFVVFASLDRCFRKVLVAWLRRAACQQPRAVGDARGTASECRT